MEATQIRRSDGAMAGDRSLSWASQVEEMARGSGVEAHHPPQDEQREGSCAQDDQGHANQAAIDHARVTNERNAGCAQAVS